MPQQWQEEAAARMTRFLARPARNAKTRAYLATLPKRKKIIVKPEDYPLLVTRAEARLDAALQALRDAQRYADWERRGKPLSPSAERKDRRRPRAVQRSIEPFRVRLYEAQEGLCGLCGEHIYDVCDGTLDHVVPRALGGQNAGNLLLAHGRCNNVKADRPPTREELEMLELVNARIAIAAAARERGDAKQAPSEGPQSGAESASPDPHTDNHP